jgi:uncharacterized peroxidase-related enzyme
MAFIQTQPMTTSCEKVRELYARQQDHWGFVPNYAKVFSHRPEALARWGRLLAELRRPVSDRRFELVTLAAALELGSTPCALAHGRALADLSDDETVCALAEGREAEVLDPAEAALVRYSRSVARDATAVQEAEIDELRSLGFSDAEIFDVAALAAARSFLTKTMDALGCLADRALSANYPALAHVLTVGRPVDRTAVERLPERVSRPAA